MIRPFHRHDWRAAHDGDGWRCAGCGAWWDDRRRCCAGVGGGEICFLPAGHDGAHDPDAPDAALTPPP